MDIDSAETSQERATSSEPCATRPKPFDDTDRSARKRQRINSGPRSESEDIEAISPSNATTPNHNGADSRGVDSSLQPQTPPSDPSNNAISAPTSSKVTLNLRSNKSASARSTNQALRTTPSKMSSPAHNARQDTEAMQDTATGGSRTASSSSSTTVGSPKVELVDEEDIEVEYADSPTVEIIDDDDEVLLDIDPVLDFPYAQPTEQPVATLRKVARALENDSLENPDIIIKLSDWLEESLSAIGNSDRRIFQSYQRHSDFWDKLPGLIIALNDRNVLFGDWMHRRSPGRRSIIDFFRRFAELTARFVKMDARTLDAYDFDTADTMPRLASGNYLRQLNVLINENEYGIASNLVSHFHFDWFLEGPTLIKHFLDASDGQLHHLRRLVRGQIGLIQKHPKSIEDTTEPCRLVGKVMRECKKHADADGGAFHGFTRDRSGRLVEQGYQFYLMLAPVFENIVEKHPTCVNRDTASCLLDELKDTFELGLSQSSSPAADTIRKYSELYPAIPHDQLPSVIAGDWTFGVLKKFIVCGQMQVRVLGVTKMCNELLAIFNCNKGMDERHRHSIMRFFSEFLIANKLVDYIVGIGSHPELIAQSGHIIGFLVATKAYGDKETDLIWQTIATSEDPRVVEAILHMQDFVVNLYDVDQLLYYCKKAMSLPLAGFTGAMKSFLLKVFKYLQEKAPPGHHIDAQPYELCVRLLQESSIARPESPLGVVDVQLWASTALRDLSSFGPESSIRHRIYKALTQDISERSPTSPGSIVALCSMVGNRLPNDLRIVTDNHDLTRLIVEHIEYTNKHPCHTPMASLDSNYRMSCRELLFAIIIYEPNSLTGDLGKRLWTALVGQGAPSQQDRHMGWQILNKAVSRASGQNPFLRMCFEEYLPTLDPSCYLLGALDFAREALTIWLRETEEDLLDKDDGLEQLWRMALTAPRNTIEEPAISMLVDHYVDSPSIQSMTKARAHTVHLKLVRRCLGQLSDAAAQLLANAGAEPMVMSDAVPYVSKEELCFTRSLVILRQFLRSYQSKPHLYAQKRKLVAGSTTALGTPFEVKYQVVDSHKHGDREILMLGEDNTIADLFAFVAKAVGFTNFKLYHWGVEVSVDQGNSDAPLSTVDVGKGLLLVHKQDGDVAGNPWTSKSASLEAEIMNHFKELYDYLAMDARVAGEIYHFLVQFPIYPELLATFDSDTTSWRDVFPLKQPFKCLYTIHALRQRLASATGDGSQQDDGVSARSLRLIASAIINPEVIDSCGTVVVKNTLELELIRCLGRILQDCMPPESAVSANLSSALLERLLDLLNKARLDVDAILSVPIVTETFETILDACILSRPFWTAFAMAPSTATLLRSLLLGDSRLHIRRGVMKSLKKKCTFVQGFSKVSALEIGETFWPLVFSLIRPACSMTDNCDETLELALSIFKALTETPHPLVDVGSCLIEWCRLLLAHNSCETVGFSRVDPVARGISVLLNWCTSYCVRHQHPVMQNDFALGVLSKHLFPPLSQEVNNSILEDRSAILNSLTRKNLYDVILNLTKLDEAQYRKAIRVVSELPPYDRRDDGIYPTDVGFHFDRSKLVRTSTGYVGLKNQSNTCYLNSLMTQLFMNPMFRKFMLNITMQDPMDDQMLLLETQKLFGHMQNSYRRYVDPSAFTWQIRTYDETNIDVNIQMDVDEFYNLLFDRWESQIQLPADKRSFRSFYGGQLVQQVKSKECPHISERLEPFSAIQCDIKGKSTLEESLQAYVDGEVMEGDNKYKCSTCDKHVNAVKRACLKDIPDSIIFHLKRFDFNLRTMQRSKINDYFKFPNTIDMRPYTVEHLMEPDEPLPSDPFELVGILVHAGTAESGHYYSYIRERPSSGIPSWFEFNDDNVTHFDPANIESHCFGGMEYRNPDTGTFPFEKSWSAYMLFYQRSSVVQAQQQEMMASREIRTPKMPMPSALSNLISQENELVLRKYLLNDEGHPGFVLKMMENDHHVPNKQISEGHELENLSMAAVVCHLDHVVSRSNDKQSKDLEEYVTTLKDRVGTCLHCARAFLEWMVEHVESLRCFILRNQEHQVRTDLGNLIYAAIGLLRVTIDGFVYEYSGFEDDMTEGACENLFERLIQTFMRVHDLFHVYTRSWPEYFGLLWRIASLGIPEAVAFVESGFLVKTLEILTADPNMNNNQQYSRMLNNISKRPKPVPVEGVICLLDVLMKACDLPAGEVSMRANRRELESAIDNDGRMPLNSMERNLMIQHWTRGNINILVEKLLQYNQAPLPTQEIIGMMLEAFDDSTTGIFNAIRIGLKKSTVHNVEACIDAALTFLKKTEQLDAAEKMIQHVCWTVTQLDHSDVKEHFRFLLEAPVAIQENQWLRNHSFDDFILRQIPLWAPSLLTAFDPTTRADAEEYIESKLFLQMPVPAITPEEMARYELWKEIAQLLGIACLKYLHSEYIRPRQQVLRSHIAPLWRILESCKQYIDADGEGENDRHFMDLIGTAESGLRRLMIDEQDQELSDDVEDWDGSDDDALSTSELPDQNIEVLGTPYEDLDADGDLDINSSEL